jgi:hypothetical protein
MYQGHLARAYLGVAECGYPVGRTVAKWRRAISGSTALRRDQGRLDRQDIAKRVIESMVDDAASMREHRVATVTAAATAAAPIQVNSKSEMSLGKGRSG